VKIHLPEELYSEIDKMTGIDFYIPSMNRTLKGKIDSKGTTINRIGKFSITSYLDNGKKEIPAGIFAVATIVTEKKERLVVDPASLKNLGNRKGDVLSVVESVVKSNLVYIGSTFGNEIEIKGDVPDYIVKNISGTKAGETVKIKSDK